MAVDIHKNYPWGCLEDSFVPKDGEGIVAGMFAFLNSTTQKLEKAVGASGEYAMLCMNNQPLSPIENSGKIQVVKENGSFLTDQFVAGAPYVMHVKLQVSTDGGHKGKVTVHAGGASSIVGRFLGFDSILGTTMLKFDLVRD